MEAAQRMDVTAEYRARASQVNYEVKLPESELEVMMAVWEAEPPINTAQLMKRIGLVKGWKPPTLISFLTRLEERGFVMSYKQGKERIYVPLAERNSYVDRITQSFVAQFHEGSFVSMLKSLYRDKTLTDGDVDSLLAWLKSSY